jgi:aminoglycoside phosphotransferase (APT) family kinase protein
VLSGYNEITKYLLAQELISRGRIVAGDLALIDASRRNSNVRVVSEAGPSYFLKQETRARAKADGGFASIAYEAKVYRLLARILGANTFSSYLPRYYRFDQEEQLLVLENLAGSISLSEWHSRHGRFSPSIAKRLGDALARLHHISEVERAAVEESLGLSAGPPWGFSLTEPGQSLYLNSSTSSLEFVRILQQERALCRSFDRLQSQWNAVALIHGDLRWANCLVSQASPRSRSLKIVDWELARLGDPCWDIATVFSEYLSCWLSSIPIAREMPPDELLDFARCPLDRLQPAIRAFWTAYAERTGLGTRDADDWLLRSTRYASVRLVQTAFEHLQTSETITDSAICALQLCANILAKPLDAANALLGLSFPVGLYGQAAIS